MKIQRHHSQSGIALMTVLIVMAGLMAMSFIFAYHIKMEVKLARNASFDAEFEWLGRSGVELARYVLANDGTGPGGSQIDSKMNKWAGGPGDTNGVLAGLDLSNYQLGIGTLSVKIVDQDSKFNINAANEVILRQALTLIGADASLTPTVVDSIMDWRDTDSSQHSSGAESEYYKTLDPPYFAKDAPIDDLTELLLVKGVTPAMFWGSGAGDHASQVFQREKARRSNFEEPIYAVGLNDLFTPLSSRLININTATRTVLQIIPEIDENIASAIITARSGPDGSEGSEDDTPFRSPQELGRVPGLPPTAVQFFAPYMTVRSLVFELTVKATIGTQTRTYVAMVRRNSQRDIQVLNFYWK